MSYSIVTDVTAHVMDNDRDGRKMGRGVFYSSDLGLVPAWGSLLRLVQDKPVVKAAGLIER